MQDSGQPAYIGQPGPGYGDFADPNDWGGGSTDKPGGGLVRLKAGRLQLDGQILADGQSAYSPSGISGGAGGGIRLDVEVLSGSGLIRAAGGGGGVGGYYGQYHGGGGGGGRVAVYARDYSGFDTNRITAPGGGGAGAGTVYLRDVDSSQGVLIVSDGGSSGGSTPLGASGTNWYRLSEPLVIQGANAHVTGEHAGMTLDFLAPVLLVRGASLQTGDVHVRSGLGVQDGSSVGVVGTFYLDTPMSLSTGAVVSVKGSLLAAVPVTVSLGAQVSVEGTLSGTAPVSVLGGLLTADQVLAPSCYVQNGGKVASLASTATTMHWLSVVVSNDLVVDGSSWIDVSGKGYVAGRTTGNSGVGVPTCLSGGSYGGLGGPGYDTGNSGILVCSGQSGPVYGDFADPNDWGGGSADTAVGGGLVRLKAGRLQLDGQVLADGQSAGSQTGLSGGAGGGIRLDAEVLFGSGSIRAAGGWGGGSASAGNYDHEGGGGGGGRVAVYARDYSGFDTKCASINNICKRIGTGHL